MRDQCATETHESGALRRGLAARKTTEATEGSAIFERLGELDVGEVIPHRQQQRLEYGQRRPSRFTLARWLERLQQSCDRLPIDQFGKLVER